MAQKFGNARWVKEGYLDNRVIGLVVGQIRFAGLGKVDFCLKGNLNGEIEGKGIAFDNPKYVDDPRASDSLEDFLIPQIGQVSLISFDPHPLLDPHPYVEWFSLQDQHYRFELSPGDAWIMNPTELEAVEVVSQRLQQELGAHLLSPDT